MRSSPLIGPPCPALACDWLVVTSPYIPCRSRRSGKKALVHSANIYFATNTSAPPQLGIKLGVRGADTLVSSTNILEAKNIDFSE